jgi:alpha-tubulin suppressor-like RCC1 family protein
LCWGGNRHGELGDGTANAAGQRDATTPREVPGLADVRSFVAGANMTCAVTGAGAALCWGDNTDGRLGDGTTANSPSPVQVVGLEASAAQISATGGSGCAVMDSGAIKCWGENEKAQLGSGSSSAMSLTPVDVVGVSDASFVQAGASHTCALLTGGTVKCWGSDTNGQVGTNHTGNEPTPFAVPGLTNVSQLSTHGSSNCVVLGSPSSIKCWGADFYGELGDGGGSYSRTPRTLPGF